MPLVDLGPASVFYAEFGEPSASPCVVLASANPGCSLDWNGLVPLLVERHCRVLAIDWPGYGQSPAPLEIDRTEGAMFMARILKLFVETLKLPPSIIIGNSVGGRAAVNLALSHSPHVSKVIAVSSGGFTPHNAMTRSFCRVMASSWGPSPYRFARFYLGHQSTSPVVKEMLLRARNEQNTPSQLAVNKAVWQSFTRPEHDLRPLLKATPVEVPVMLIFGAQDYVITPWMDGKEARKCFSPETPFVVMPSGHAPFAEIPEEFMKTIEKFVFG